MCVRRKKAGWETKEAHAFEPQPLRQASTISVWLLCVAMPL